MNSKQIIISDSPDDIYRELIEPVKVHKGEAPPLNEAVIDHINPMVNGGDNSYSNAQVVSRHYKQMVKKTKWTS